MSRRGNEYNRGIPPWREKTARLGLCGGCQETGIHTTTVFIMSILFKIQKVRPIYSEICISYHIIIYDFNGFMRDICNRMITNGINTENR